MTDTTFGPLSGVKILDLSWGAAGPMTSMLLADSGADVIRVEAPFDPVRDEVAYRVWNRGKRSIALDLRAEDDRSWFLEQAETCDVVIESFEPGVTSQLGIDAPTLRARNPRLVYCSITGYGADGKDAHRPALDSLVAARTGLQWDQRGWTGTAPGRISGGYVPLEELDVPELPASRFDVPGPTMTRSTWPSLGAAFLASVGIAAALRAREVTGGGDHVHTSLLQGAIACAGPTWQRVENPASPGYWMWVTDRRAPEGLFECSDGRWVHFWTMRPTLILEAAESDVLQIDGRPDNMRDPDMIRIGMDAEDLVVLYHYYPLLADAFNKFPSDEWVAFGAARNLGIAKVRSPEEALMDEALLADGCVVQVDDSHYGTVRHAGVLIEFSDTPGRVRGPAPHPNEHERELRTAPSETSSVSDRQPGSTSRTLPGPLAGIKVLDLGLGVAGPWGGKILADLGADVIKVHALHDGYWAQTHMGLATNWGKRSIALNLKDANAREVLERLLADADVLAHNMRPGAAERLGIGYEELHVKYPTLICCQTRGFEDGPRSLQPGTDQTANALAGVEFEDGGSQHGNPPFWSRVNTGDTGNGYLWATGVIQALFHRERTGEGQRVGTSIINACLFNASYALCQADGSAVDRPRIGADQRGFSALHRLYRTADEWVCLAVLDENGWPDLCDALGAPELVEDARFATAAARADNDDDLADALQQLFALRQSDEIVSVFDKRELPCEVSSTTYPTTFFDDPEIRDRGWLATAHLPGIGRLEQAGVLVDFAVNPGRVVGPPCQVGQHTIEILEGLGYTRAEIDELVGSDAILAMSSR